LRGGGHHVEGDVEAPADVPLGHLEGLHLRRLLGGGRGCASHLYIHETCMEAATCLDTVWGFLLMPKKQTGRRSLAAPW